MKKFIITFLLLFMSFPALADSNAGTVLDRVIKSGVIRCGYQVYPPYISKNLENGKMEGVYPEIFEELAQQAGLKIEWVEEVGSDTLFASLDSGRFDGPNAYDLLNAEDVTFQVKDGDLIEILANQYFPKAKKSSAPGMTDISQLFLNLSTRKVTALIDEPVFAGTFIRNNPDKIKRAGGKNIKPLRIFPASVAVAMGEHNLMAFINTALKSLVESGFVKASIAKNIPNSDELVYPPEPVQ